MQYFGLLIPIIALSIPIVAIVSRHKQRMQENKLKEMELQKKLLELEVEKQNSKIKLLELENKNLDRIINQ